MFAIDHNTNAPIIRVGLTRQTHVCPVIGLVTDDR